MQRLQLFLLTLGQLLIPLIVPNGLLHRFNIRFFRDITDIFCDKFLDIYNGAEGDSLLHHPHDLLIVNIPLCQKICPILLLGIIELSSDTVCLQERTKVRKVDGLPLANKAVFRQWSVVKKKMFSTAPIAPAVEHNSRNKGLTLHIIPKFAGNEAGKIFSSSGVWIIFIHIRPQVSLQRPLRFFIGCLIEVAGIRFSQKNNLECINYGGFASSILSSQKIDIVHFDEFF